MNIFKKIKWFFTVRNYPFKQHVDFIVQGFINHGKLLETDNFRAIIKFADKIYGIWIENYPYAWLSSCVEMSSDEYEENFHIMDRRHTTWKDAVPSKKTSMLFEEWLEKEKECLFKEQNPVPETDNTHQTNLKETAMSNETSCEFKTFDHVLVRDHHSSEWLPDIFVRYSPVDEDGDENSYPFETISSKYVYCIPYDESLAFTTGTTSVDFKEGDTVEFIYLRESKWFRGVITEVSTKEKKGDNYIYRVSFTDTDGDRDWLWCKPDQLREACANVDADTKEENEEETKEHKFQVGQKVWYKGQYSDDKWTMATVEVIDFDDDDLPYRIELFTNNCTWWVKEAELKSIDEYPF